MTVEVILPPFSELSIRERVKDLKDAFMTSFEDGFVELIKKEYPDFDFTKVSIPGDAFILESKERYYVTYKDVEDLGTRTNESPYNKECSAYLVSPEGYKTLVERFSVTNTVDVICKRAAYMKKGRAALIVKGVKEELLSIVSSAMEKDFKTFDSMLQYVEDYAENIAEDEDAVNSDMAPLVKDLLKNYYDSDIIAVLLNCVFIEIKKGCKDTLLIKETPEFIDENYNVGG